MSRIEWDKSEDRVFETGVDQGVLYVKEGNTYGSGVAWNGLISVTESPSGAEATPLYADNIKYLNLISNEDFGATIEAYTYPDEFAACNGEVSLATGLVAGQQKRKSFGLCYRTKVGNNDNPDAGYKYHIIYNALAAPSEKAYNTVNDSPEAITFSWELTTTPEKIGGDYRPTACLTIDSTKISDTSIITALEAKLYGGADSQPTLPTPAEVIALLGGTAPAVVNNGETGETGKTGAQG